MTTKSTKTTRLPYNWFKGSTITTEPRRRKAKAKAMTKLQKAKEEAEGLAAWKRMTKKLGVTVELVIAKKAKRKLAKEAQP